MRLRDWGVGIGELNPGPRNSLTDVEGVRVGSVSIVRGKGALRPGAGPVRTGVTAVWPCGGDLYCEKVTAAVHLINGFTKTMGLVQVAEMGCIETPILITNTLNVGKCADAMIDYLYSRCGWTFRSINCVVAECNDSYLNDSVGRHVHDTHVFEALETAGRQAVEEGAVGAGTGMSCYQLKGGIGTASRRIHIGRRAHHVGVLVCANMGELQDLRVDGIHVGPMLQDRLRIEGNEPVTGGGSIIVLVATDVPLETSQLERLAKRCTHGLARTGTNSDSGSGDVVIAWTSARRLRAEPDRPFVQEDRLNDEFLGALFRAAAECTEESVLNALWQAETMTGRDDNRREKLPLDSVREILETHQYGFHQAGKKP